MPFIRIGRLRTLEAREKQFNELLSLLRTGTQKDIDNWRTSDKMQTVTARWLDRINTDMWLAGPPMEKLMSIKSLMDAKAK